MPRTIKDYIIFVRNTLARYSNRYTRKQAQATVVCLHIIEATMFAMIDYKSKLAATN